MPLSSKLTRSIVINAHAEKVWTTLKAFGGNEKFNPLVTSSKVDGHGEGSKRTCYVSMDGGKTISETIETLTFLDDQNRTMTYKVISAPNTPFEGLVNKVNVNLIKADDKRCMVEFTGSFDALDDGARNNLGKSLLDAYDGILKGLKNLHEK